ncbi:DUF3465 domain-containing protein [Bdellovibrio sp.]|uniref:DUF3465 domain-containing protein n=1 Tax=Bdellovibrio TaxID=958 RepID=UPI0032213B11
MMKSWVRVAIYVFAFVLVVFSQMDSAEAARFKQYQETGNINNDREIVDAVNNRRREDFVEGADMVVTKILPDDNSGLEHQKWTVRLSNGETMQAVYNLDMCPRVPLKVGDRVAMGGQFIWTQKGGLLHWLHHDPRGRRPDGYVYVNGTFYCKE